jgi:hypothetical protein
MSNENIDEFPIKSSQNRQSKPSAFGFFMIGSALLQDLRTEIGSADFEPFGFVSCSGITKLDKSRQISTRTVNQLWIERKTKPLKRLCFPGKGSLRRYDLVAGTVRYIIY